MSSRILLPLFTAFTALPMIASALMLTPADLYRDVRTNSVDAAGINLLTREKIVQGYTSSIFGPTRTINRAEFLKIALMASGTKNFAQDRSCFVDVLKTDWFASYVCTAKAARIVKGFPDGRFHPEETVTYGEALKMLILLFTYKVPFANGHWAEQYYKAAAARRVDLPITIDLDRSLTRGQAARLVAAFLAESRGQLEELRRAESGQYLSPTSSSSSRSSSVSSSSSVSRVSHRPLDPISDIRVRSQFLLLGESSPVLGAASFFIEEEPLDVTAISVNLTSEVPTIQSLLVYDDDRRYLGRATLNTSTSTTNRNYRLEIPAGSFRVEKRAERRVYFRAQLASKDAGGIGNQHIQISNVVLQADGSWSNDRYTKQSDSSDIFPVFVTARSTIASVVNAGLPQAPLVTSTNQIIGSFTLSGRKTDSSAKIAVSSLVFQIEQTGQVTLSNVAIGTSGLPDRTNCVVSSTHVTCSNIPESVGSLTDAPQTIVVYGDIAAGNTAHASLRLTLNETGSSSSAGSITWTDGTSVFTWIAKDGPIAMGTYYKY